MRAEWDSHADTCAFGLCCSVIYDTGKRVSVEGYNGQSTLRLKDIKIVSVAVAYDCPITNHTFILLFHQVLHIPTMKRHLLCPFQLREHDIVVNDTPLLHLHEDKRTHESHCLICDDPVLKIPFEIEGIMSGFTVRMPTDAEMADRGEELTTHINMTSTSDWEPAVPDFAEREAALAASISSDYEMRHLQSRLLNPLQAGTRLVDTF